MHEMEAALRVIPESPQGLSGTHKHRSILKTPRVWVPALRFAAAGMTLEGLN
jgi:hypothetical protein